MNEEILNVGIAALNRGDFKLAQKTFVKLVKENPQNDVAWFWLSKCVELDKRVLCLQQAIKINPNNLEAHNALSEINQSSDQILAEILAVSPNIENEELLAPLPSSDKEQLFPLDLNLTFITHKEEFVEQRWEIVRELKSLLIHVQSPHKEQNEKLFNSAITAIPPIENEIWGQIAFVIGRYGHLMARQSLSFGHRQGLWKALLWAVWYEQCYRPKMLSQRVKELLAFFNANSEDLEFFTWALPGITPVVPGLNKSSLDRLQKEITKYASTSITTTLLLVIERAQSSIEQPLPNNSFLSNNDNEIERSLYVIDQLWSFLDKKREQSNQKVFNEVKENINDPQAPSRLSPLAGVISGNVLYRFCRLGQDITDIQLDQAILLVNFSRTYSSNPKFVEQARRNHLLLSGLHRLRSRSLDPSTFVQNIKSFTDTLTENRVEQEKELWTDLLMLVTKHLKDLRLSSSKDTVEAQSWIRTFAERPEIVNREAIGTFIDEVQLHEVSESMSLDTLIRFSEEETRKPTGPLAFLGKQEQQEFQESIIASRFDKVIEILKNARLPLLSAVSRVLADSSFQELAPPRESIRIGRYPDNLFPQARRLIFSQNANERQKALGLFEQASKETARNPYLTSIAREWLLFAQAKVSGPVSVVAEWEEDRRSNASWEEIWNIAAFYLKFGSSAERALQVLMPGVESLKAPFSHLRFALYCGVQILLQQSEVRSENSRLSNQVINFLIENLPKQPIAECYLCWLLLVEEAKIDIDLIQQAQNLGLFQQLAANPITLLQPENIGTSRDDPTKIELFRDELQKLKLEDTWRLWVNDFAERNKYYYKGWEWLSEACERDRDLEGAADALQQNLEYQIGQYERSHKSSRPRDIKSVRLALVKLFEFYKRNALTLKGQAAYNKYSRKFPTLWKGDDRTNTALINLTRPYIPTEPAITTGSTTETPRASSGSDVWNKLNIDLAEVKDIQSLKEKDLPKRLVTAIGLTPLGDSVSRQRAEFIKNLLTDICNLEEMRWQHTDLLGETDRINKELETARGFAEQDASLKAFKALVAALRRTFEYFSKSSKLQPVPEIERTLIGSGIPDDMLETALVINITNPGPGEITNLRLEYAGKDEAITSRGKVSVASLGVKEKKVVAIPVRIHLDVDKHDTIGQIAVNYRWGIIDGLSVTQNVDISWFSFQDYLQQHGINAHEWPNPFVYDQAIEFGKHNPNLFQGRRTELGLIQTTIMRNNPPGVPIYFHGIRRVGKTSLLNRIAQSLQGSSFAPLVFNVFGCDASSRTLDQITRKLTENIVEAITLQWGSSEEIQPITVDHPDPLSVIEPFFNSLRSVAAGRQPVLLIDEFQVMVGDQTTALLDLFRRVYDRGDIWFVMSGNLRPEPLRQLSPRTQLFPLMQRPVDFLSLDEVAELVRMPTQGFGIEIPDSTIRSIYTYTAGMPNFVGKIASIGLDRLNAEHRNVLTPQDVERISQILIEDPSNFKTSWFSPLILNETEQKTAIRFAQMLPEHEDGLPIEKTLAILDARLIQDLEEKYILELRHGNIQIKGRLLRDFLKRQLIKPDEVAPVSSSLSKKVGLFVDVENMWPHIPSRIKPKEIGDALIEYGSKYGEVVCKWACADPRNLPDDIGIRLGLEAAGFDVSFPRPELGRKPNLVDFLLLERMTDERTHRQPDVYIIISGDKDYYERSVNYLNLGYTVRIAAARDSQARVYDELVRQRQQLRFAEGYTESDFFVDDLNSIIQTMLL